MKMQNQQGLSSIWSESFRLWPAVFKRAWWWLVLSLIIEEVFEWAIKVISQGDERLYIIGGLWALLIQLLISSIGIIIISQMIADVKHNKPSDVWGDLQRNLKYVFIESTRALLPVLLKGLLLIVPGVIEWVRLTFVPYVAQFDQEYKAGRVDALQRSRDLVKGRFWYVTALLILSLALSIVPRLYLKTKDMASAPVFFGVVFFVCMASELMSDMIIYLAYIQLEDSGGNKVSLS